MIKVLLWDLDGTIMNFLKAENYAIKKCFAAFGINNCDDAMVERYSKINTKYWQMLERGEITKPQVQRGRFEELFQLEGIEFTQYDELNKMYQIALGDKIFFNDDSFTLLKSLQGKYKQYAITNGTITAQENKLRRSGLNEIFDGVFISDKVGFEKPSIKFFDAVFSKIGDYAKDEMLVIGDSLTSDIKGANNADLPCCWYNPNGAVNDKNLRIDYEIRNLNEILNILE